MGYSPFGLAVVQISKGLLYSMSFLRGWAYSFQSSAIKHTTTELKSSLVTVD